MKTPRLSYQTRLALLGLPALAALVIGLAPACSSTNPAPPTSASSSTSGSTSSSSGGGGAGGATTSSSASTTASGTGGASTSSSSGGDGGPACVSDGGATGCYSCPPTTNDQFLNACAPNGDQCTHFDNASKLPFWDGGALPVP